MKFDFRLIILAAMATLCSLNFGCTWMSNRTRDLGDVITVSGGTGYSFGIKARVGPAQAGLYASAERRRAGLRGGQFVYDRVHDLAESLYDGEGDQWFFWGSDGFEPDRRELAADRGKLFRSRSIFEYTPLLQFPEGDKKFPLYYFTQVDATVGFAWFHLRLGANPGELLDFIGGLFCLDLMRDDLKPQIENPVQTIDETQAQTDEKAVSSK